MEDNSSCNSTATARENLSETKEQPGNQKLGLLLTEQGALSEEQLAKALQKQTENRNKRVGDILAEKKTVSRTAIENAIKKAQESSQIPKNARVGEILIAAGLISREQLENALGTQKDDKSKKIGSLLIKGGFITENQLLLALAHKFNLRFVNLEEKRPSTRAINAISALVATTMHVIPVELRNKTLVVATSDPTDPLLAEYLSFNTGLTIELVVATKKQILDIQQEFYDKDASKVDELIEEMTSDVEVVEDEFDVEQLNESDSKVINLVYKVLLSSVAQKASDIHFEPGFGNNDLEIRFRVDGTCRFAHKIPSTYKKAVISRLKILANLDITERRKPQSGKIFLKSKNKRMEFRVETAPTAGGQEDAVLRVMSNANAIPLEQMGFSTANLESFKELLAKPYGMILCVGPTGSGKTTSLHSALGHINSPERKIWTAEDPVEILQPGLRQMQVNSKIGLTFSEALRSFLRLDPDVIMVGEMRDKETAQIAVEASLTGHLMFSTLHTNSAAETVTRLLDIGIEPFHFADALLGILAQRLVLTLCDHCKESYNPKQNEYEKLIQDYNPEIAQIDGLQPYSKNTTLMRKKGCEKCNGTGYLGRAGIHELLLGSEDLKQAIVKKQAISDIRELAIQNGMRTLKMDGIQKVFQGVTDYEQVLKVCI